MSSPVDLMLAKWPLYASRLILLPPIAAMPEQKRAAILSFVRDAYLRCAPTIEDPPAAAGHDVHQYVFGVTLRLLAQVAKYVESVYSLSEAFEQLGLDWKSIELRIGRSFDREALVEPTTGEPCP